MMNKDCDFLFICAPILYGNKSHQNQSQHTEAGKNCGQFPDDIFKCILLNENIYIFVKILLKFAPKGTVNNIPALVQIMGWRPSGDKPLSQPMMA